MAYSRNKQQLIQEAEEYRVTAQRLQSITEVYDTREGQHNQLAITTNHVPCPQMAAARVQTREANTTKRIGLMYALNAHTTINYRYDSDRHA